MLCTVCGERGECRAGYQMIDVYNSDCHFAPCEEESPTRSHIALIAPSLEALEEYYIVAVAAGGKDNGAPGPRTYLSGGNQACFVIDLDDNNIEAVTVL